MFMPEIFKFDIPEAYAIPNDNGGITVQLHYPAPGTRKYITDRVLSGPEDVAFGIDMLERLAAGEGVQIGTPEMPSRPSSGAVLDVLNDKSFFTHRRDGYAPVHKWYNGVSSGFPSNIGDFNDVTRLQSREGAEESILFTREDQPRIYVPLDSAVARETTLRRVRQLGLQNELFNVPVRLLDGPDVLEVYDHNRELVSSNNGFIYLSWEEEVNVAFARVRSWYTLTPNNVAAIDAEGAVEGDGFSHFDREMFYLGPRDVARVQFGEELCEPTVYRLEIRDGIGYPTLQTTAPEKAPGYNFMPDDALRRMLSSMEGAGHWYGNWIKYEIEQARARLEVLTGKTVTTLDDTFRTAYSRTLDVAKK